jgi:hypothetical protein
LTITVFIIIFSNEMAVDGKERTFGL